MHESPLVLLSISPKESEFFIQFKDVSKSFQNKEEAAKKESQANSHQVLDRVCLSVTEGEFLVLVGPSGCGKSTLLRCLAGLETPTSGDILIGGKSVLNLSARERGIAMVFQNYALYPHMNVQENLSFGLLMRKLPEQEIKRRTLEISELLQLTPYLQRRPKDLSGGQRQRVALGRALVTEAPIVLFDEPLSNLDAHLRQQMRFEIKKIHQSIKNTIVYVTHDQVEATTMADRLAILNRGKIQQVDTPKNVFTNPANEFVAKFIGSPEMNLIPEDLFPSGSKSVVIGFRPEDAELQLKSVSSSQSASGFSGSGRVELVEFLGSQQLLYVQWQGKTLRFLDETKTVWTPNQEVAFSLDTKHLHRFDSQSGARV